jgi:cobalamin-dependent methionine synthase I
VGVVEELPREDFDAIYRGEGCNPPESPLPHIVPRSEGLELYAATVGERLSARIGELFEEHDVAVAYFLDAIASAAADRLSDLLAARFHDRLTGRGVPPERAKVLPYSPGYCGWHVSGQKRLFARLHPEQIGIHLNESCLMTPLKSVSGVLVGGTGEAHRFKPDFPFCEACLTHECGRRMASVLRH